MNQLISGTPAGGPPAGANPIKDSNTESFMADVIDASQQVPVIVDFWAPWCGPCKQLGPAIEKAVREARGAVKLVKIDIDQNQELAAQMRIQSIPAVYAFFKGRPVDGFMGAVPESQIKSFVQRLIKTAGGAAGPSPIDQALEQAEAALTEGDPGTASAIFGQVLQHEPTNAAAIGGLARCHLQAGEIEEARRLLDSAPPEAAKDKSLAAARAALELAEQAAAASGAAPDLLRRLELDANDHQARFDLALALYAESKNAEAIDALLEIVRRNRAWNEEAARKQMVKIFEALGPIDPVTVAGRRKLSSILFS